MLRRVFCKLLLVAIVIFSLLALSNAVMAQGRSADAFERVKEAQEKHTDVLMAMDGIEGTAIGYNQNDRLAIKVFTAGPGVRGIPQTLDGVPVQVVVTGKFYALQNPYKVPPGLAKKVPKAPTGLTATAYSNNQIDLGWSDNSNNETGFSIECSNDGITFNWITNVSPNVTTCSDTGLDASTEYFYRVYAYNTEYDSDYSNVASATTFDGTVESPDAPSNLNAVAVSSSQIDLSWSDNSNNETGFSIECSNDGITFNWIINVNLNVTTYSDTGLDASTEYFYRVYAYNTEYDSDYSNVASAETDPLPDKPSRWYERPVPIGVSTGHPDITAGTIGCRVTKTVGENVYVYALSNNHVYANCNKANIGDNVLQPGRVDGGVNPDDAIGILDNYVPIVFGPRGENDVDAAIALCVDTLDNATPQDGYGTPSSDTLALSFPEYQDLPVQKYGRTTGLTHGKVDSISWTGRIYYGSGGFAIFVDQIGIIGTLETPSFSQPGDSGSLIVTDDGNNPVGLLFAGNDYYTIANPIDEVLGAFGVDIDGGE